MSSSRRSIGVRGGRIGRGGSSGGRGSNAAVDSDEERKRHIRSDVARKRGALRYTRWGLTPAAAFFRREADDAEAGSSRGGARRAPSPVSSDFGYVDYVSVSAYEPSTDESEGDKVVPADFVDTDEAEEAAIQTLIRRSERAAAAAKKREREDERHAIIQVEAAISKEEEMKTHRIKCEVVEQEVADLVSDDE